jgi:WD40 repeat protein
MTENSALLSIDLINHQFGHVKFFPDGDRFVATSTWSLLGIWRFGSDRPEAEVKLTPNPGTSMDLDVAPTGGLLAIARAPDLEKADNRLLILKEDGTQVHEIVKPHRDQLVRGISFSSDGKYLASFSRSSIRIWSSATGEPVGAPIAADDLASAAGVRFIDGDKSIVGAFEDGSVRVFDDIGTAKPKLRYFARPYEVPGKSRPVRASCSYLPTKVSL